MDNKDNLLPELIFIITDLQVLKDQMLFEELSHYINYTCQNMILKGLISLLIPDGCK